MFDASIDKYGGGAGVGPMASHGVCAFISTGSSLGADLKLLLAGTALALVGC